MSGNCVSAIRRSTDCSGTLLIDPFQNLVWQLWSPSSSALPNGCRLATRGGRGRRCGRDERRNVYIRELITVRHTNSIPELRNHSFLTGPIGLYTIGTEVRLCIELYRGVYARGHCGPTGCIFCDHWNQDVERTAHHEHILVCRHPAKVTVS